MKKIIIFTSSGGGGQQTVAQCLQDYLGTAYDLKEVFVFSEILDQIDAISRLTGGRMSGEKLYNYCLTKKLYRILNTIIYPLGVRYYKRKHKKIVSLIRTYLQKEQADLLISIVPIVNQPIATVAEELGMPFLLLCADIDPTMYIETLQQKQFKNFLIGVPYDTPQAQNACLQKNISDKQIIKTGYPIRATFAEKKNHTVIKDSFDIPHNKPIILVLLGSLGSLTQIKIAQQLASIESTAHILFCTGKNEQIKTKIEKLEYPAHLSKTVIGFTKKIADLMHISTIFITKSGSASFCEGLSLELPMIIDATDPVLAWEKENSTFLQKNNLGHVAYTYAEIVHYTDNLLQNKEKYNSIKQNLKKLSKKNGGQEIKKLIAKIFNSCTP